MESEERKQEIAINRFLAGVPYNCSTGIDNLPTYGYGKLDNNGFWEYQIPRYLVEKKNG